MDAKELEKKINWKFGKQKDHQIDENFSLIRTLETNEIVILDLNQIGDGHHLLKYASQKEIDKIVEYFKFFDEENELIPGSPEKLTEEEKQRRKEIADNELIPSDDNSGDNDSENDLIPE